MKVSVIVPIYNSEDYLDKCLDSLVNQTYKDIEIILVNDGSTDSSQNIINEYKTKYKNIKVIEISNHGQGYARNRGLDVASGEYITFVDSDDFISLNMIELLVKSLNSSDVAVCNLIKVINKKEKIFKNFLHFGNDQINFMLSHPGPVAKLYKRELIGNIRFVDNLFYEDLLFTVEIAKKVKKVSYVDENLYYYVIHDNSIMHKKAFTTKFNDIFTILDKIDIELKDYKLENEYLHIEHLYYSAVLRYIDYNRKEELKKVNHIMSTYPNFKENIYFKKKSFRFKMICILASKKCYFLLKLLKKIRR